MQNNNDETAAMLPSNRTDLPNDRIFVDGQFYQLKKLSMFSRLNYMLLFVPFGLIAKSFGLSEVYVFGLNFLAIIPLAKMLGFLTEQIASHLGETTGALLNASFGNLVELIVSIFALKSGFIRVVQASLIGSILSNLLLVLGFSFFMGGIKHSEQVFNTTAAQTSGSLMALTCLSLLIPAAFQAVVKDNIVETSTLLNLSHGTAIVLLLTYFAFLLFQLKTHTHLYSTSNDIEEEAELSLKFSFAMLAIVTILVALCSEYLVDSIDGVTSRFGLSQTFLGVILIPIVGNAAEHLTAVTVAMKNKMDLSIGIALGSSMQIALFATPLLVILGWIMNQPMTLFFDIFETTVLFVSVLIVNYLVQDGKSNWLEGFMLLASYTIIAMAFFFYPL